MTIVYVPQLPARYDQATKLWIPSINLDAAKSFGELRIMLPANANRLHIAPLVAALRDQLRDVTAEDWLVAVGDPSLIAAAVCLAVKRTGVMRLLKWDRQSANYLPVEVSI